MNTTLIIEIIIILMLSAFFSGMEIAFISSSKLRFEMDRENQGFSSRLIDTFYKHPNSFLSTLLVGNNIALVVYGILMAEVINTMILTPLGIHKTEGECPNDAFCLLAQTVLSTMVVLVVGEFLPKTLAKLKPNRILIIFAIPAYIFYILLWPISKITSAMSKIILWMMGQKVSQTDTERTFTKVDLDYLIQSNIENIEDEEDIEDEIKIFQNALDFSNVKVRDCIVPRTELNAVELHTSLSALKSLFIETGHSKIIVFQDSIDNITGFIHSSEMFHLKEDDNWTKYIKEVPIVPETMNAQKLLSIFTCQKKSLAVVVDEFGGTSGIVTLEDLVEEIFGEIEDEHDTVNYTAKEIGENEYLLSARLETEKVNEMFNLDLPESDEYLTIGGLILHKHQSFPKPNEIIKFGHLEFKIIKNTTTKIELVRLKVLR